MTFASIIIPTYNRANYIREAVDSCLHQTCKEVEVIVVDDGSTDNTKEVLSDYIDAGKIVYKWQENAGRSEARNHGARIAKGEFLLFLDSDDLLHLQAMENLEKLSKENPRSDIFGGLVNFFFEWEPFFFVKGFNSEKSFSDKQVISEVAAKIFLSTGAYIVRRNTFYKDKGFIKEFEPAEDLDFSIKTLHAGLFSWSQNFLVVSKRRHKGNTGDKDLHKASFKISKYYTEQIKANKFPNFNKEQSRLLSNLYERILHDCINLGNKRAGIQYFGKMIVRNPVKFILPSKWKLCLYLLFFSGKNSEAQHKSYQFK